MIIAIIMICDHTQTLYDAICNTYDNFVIYHNTIANRNPSATTLHDYRNYNHNRDEES